jgi:hypothetical protein
MTRNLKALGLALVAAFAMSAVLAVSAQAKGTLTVDVGGGGNANLTGEPSLHNGTEHYSLNTFFGSTICDVLLDGTTTQGNTELTLAPTYTNCTTNGKAATITTNGCDFEFKGGNVTSEGGAQDHFVDGTVRLNCPGSVAGMELHIYNDAGHTSVKCTYTALEFPVNQFEDGATYVNNTTATPDDVEMTLTVAISTQRTVGSFLDCGPVNQTSTHTGGFTLRAYKDGLTHNVTNQLSLTLTDPTP